MDANHGKRKAFLCASTLQTTCLTSSLPERIDKPFSRPGSRALDLAANLGRRLGIHRLAYLNELRSDMAPAAKLRGDAHRRHGQISANTLTATPPPRRPYHIYYFTINAAPNILRSMVSRSSTSSALRPLDYVFIWGRRGACLIIVMWGGNVGWRAQAF